MGYMMSEYTEFDDAVWRTVKTPYSTDHLRYLRDIALKYDLTATVVRFNAAIALRCYSDTWEVRHKSRRRWREV